MPRIGPALTDVGARRGPGHLRAKLRDPQATIPDDFRMAQLTTKDGRKIEGVRLNEDVDSIQVLDMGGRLHSYWKRELATIKVERRTTMPSYAGKLSDQEIDDTVAYLSTLKGESQ